MITEEQKTKAVGQYKLVMWNTFQPFMMHGFQEDHELPAAIEVAIEAGILLAKRYAGEDKPITVHLARTRASKRRATKR